MNEIYNQEELWHLPLPMSQGWVAMGLPRLTRCPLQSEKANLSLFLPQSPTEVEAGSCGGVKRLT